MSADRSGCLDRRARYVHREMAHLQDLTNPGKVYDVTDFLDEHPGTYDRSDVLQR